MLILYIIIILGWSLPSFFLKDILKYLDNINIIIIKYFFITIILCIYLAYLYFFKNLKISNYIKKSYNLPNKYKFTLFLVVLLALLSTFSILKLIKKIEISKLVPNIRALSTLLIALIGVTIYKESVSILKILGILFTVIGVYILNLS